MSVLNSDDLRPPNMLMSFELSVATLDNRYLALLIASSTVICYVMSQLWWRAVPAFFYPEEKKLEKKLASIREEANKHTGADELHIHGRLTREALQISKQIVELRKCRYSLCCINSKCISSTSTTQGCLATRRFALLLVQLKYVFPILMCFMIRFGFIIPILCFYWHRSAVVLVPHCFRFHLPIVKWAERLVMSTLLGPMAWVHGYNRNEHLETEIFEEWWSFGVFAWFAICYTSVHFSYRVMCRV